MNDFGAYEFDILYACGQGNVCSDVSNWSFTDNADASGTYNVNNTAWPSTVFIRVGRATGGLTDGSYQLTVSR